MNPRRFSLPPESVMAADYGRLRARLGVLEARRVAADDPRWAALESDASASAARVAARRASVPAAPADPSLPIAREADRIVATIRAHPVVVIAGETGSGKTTQLPKLCLAAGRGVRGLIGCTQPRRIAARSVARRVASELGTEVGGLVGFQVRFTEQVGPRALVKFMTDGILLAETQGDRWLSAYDTLIVDEAHERSLNIDFLLGYLKRLVARRRDLRVIVTSATIDTERFAAHFGGAPIVNVEGRSHPVEVRWEMREEGSERGSECVSRSGDSQVEPRGRETHSDPLSSAIVATCDRITREDPLGDVLAFLPGEREIRDLHQALERRRYRETEILPLYARLSARDQDRVFSPGPKRRIVLATNVAETSLTVPRIRHVIDPGVARINRYSHRHKVQRLHVEPISQASADQRKGRCGRVGPGVCWRLYDEQDYQARPRYTDPELLRSSLAGVILRLLSLGLGAAEDFPFLDPPGERAIADGYQQLSELDAITPDRTALTATGRTLARLPIDPKLGRMLVEGQSLGCLRELTVLAAFLAIQDPRERPVEARDAADRAHAAFADPGSDFVTILKLWDAYRTAHEDLTQSKLRDWCSARFLSFLRLREWRELHRQLLLLCDELGWKPGHDPATYEVIHRALLSGLPGNIGHKDPKSAAAPLAARTADAPRPRGPGTTYTGTRGRRYAIFPGSVLARHPPEWLLSATLLDTQRLWALTNARVEVAWVEQQAAHLVKRTHYDPHWSRERGRVLAFERVSLFGLVLSEKRRVAYERIDPVEARAIFVREALVAGEIDCRSVFVRRNQATLAAARDEEARRRRHGLLRDVEELVDWLDPRIPADIASAVALDAWVKRLDGGQRVALEWSLADVMAAEASPEIEFPRRLAVAGRDLALEYRFEPEHPSDGVSMVVPLEVLNAVPAARLGWLVPGMLRDKVAELIRGLPKALRRNFVPAPDFAAAFVAATPVDERPLAVALSAWLAKSTGVEVAVAQWQEGALAPHLRFNLRLLDETGAPLAEGRDLEALRAAYGPRARHAFAERTATQVARSGLTRFDFDELPESVRTDTGLVAYPALVDEGDSVAVRVFEDAESAAAEHGRGVATLLRLVLGDKLRSARRQLPLAPKAAIAYTAIASPDALRADVVDAAFAGLALERAARVRSRNAFDALAADLVKHLFAAAVERLEPVEETMLAYASLAPTLTPPLLGYAKANYDDLREQLTRLVHPGFARELPRARLVELPRYLKAMAIRVERLQLDPRKDQARMLLAREFESALLHVPVHPAGQDAIERLRWLIQEFRVQLFAQELGTREPVSEKRLRKLLDDLQRSPGV